MSAAPLPSNESRRLNLLREYGILDTIAEQAYDDITLLASQICGVPIALVSFIDKDRQWLKSKVGLDVSETPREHAFCAHAILSPCELMQVSDATLDDRFVDNPYVTAEPQIRFYAGAPLVTRDGDALGTLCVIDKKPRQLTQGQAEALRALSRQVVSQLELRKALDELSRYILEKDSYERQLEAYQLRLEEINATLAADSKTDKLTGLANRRHFDDLFAEEFDRANRRGLPLSLIILDVDHFKMFNDTFGHSAGDETLKAVAKSLSETKRLQDRVARYGGEEFVIVLPDTPAEGAAILAERVRKAVQNREWEHRPVTVSIGVCTFERGIGSPLEIIGAADAALYLSKQNGRNRVTIGQLR